MDINENQLQFEEALVRWLLTRYRLYDKRARFMILDVERETANLTPKDPCSLTLRAFHLFFDSQFPIQLESRCLHKKEVAAIKPFKMLTALEATRFGRDYAWIEEHASEDKSLGLVYHIPYQKKVQDSVVLHNNLGIDDRVPGPHFVNRFSDGTCCVIETLSTALASIDANNPPELWQRAAIRSGYDASLSGW